MDPLPSPGVTSHNWVGQHDAPAANTRAPSERVRGIVLLAAVAFDVWAKRRASDAVKSTHDGVSRGVVAVELCLKRC